MLNEQDLSSPGMVYEHNHRIILPKEHFFPPHLGSWRTGKTLDKTLHPATYHLSYNSQIKKLASHLFVLEPWYARPRYTTVNGCLTYYHFSSLS